MSGVNPSRDDPSQPPRVLDPILVGTLFGVLSAVGYTAANVCLRAVATDHDPFWVSSVKPVPTILLAAPVVAWQAARGSRCWMSYRACLALAAAGLFGQLAGNVAFQWSLGVVGIAICVPVTLGTMMIGGAVLGRLCLGEPVTIRSALAMLILTLAIIVLGSGSGAAHASVHSEDALAAVSSGLLALGVGAAALSGFAYAILGVVIRRAVTGSATLAGTLLVVSVCGLASLLPWSWARIGAAGMVATGWGDFSIMLLAGVFNAIAFFALGKGLRLLSVVHFNLLNASQSAMAAVAGLIFFREALTAALVAGVALTVGGLLLIEERRRKPVVDQKSPEPQDDTRPVRPLIAPTPETASSNGSDAGAMSYRTAAPRK